MYRRGWICRKAKSQEKEMSVSSKMRKQMIKEFVWNHRQKAMPILMKYRNIMVYNEM